MIINLVELTNFRSYSEARFELGTESTLVVGPNASGKTNLLEALYVLATTRSFRAAERNLVRNGSDFFRVTAWSDRYEYALGYRADPVEKKVTWGGVKKTLSGHLGEIPVTLFEPAHLEVLSGPPEGRRRYVDFILLQTDKTYAKTIQTYRRLLRQRNALLEAAPVGLRDQLFSWNIRLAEAAGWIASRRGELIRSLNEIVPTVYSDIAGSAVPIELEYIYSVSPNNYETDFLAALEKNLPRDLAAGFTTIGPHREDWKVRFKGANLGAVASRGETRSLVLALKLVEMDYLEMKIGQTPLLLLDDVFSELDRRRRAALLERLRGRQSVITTTDAESIMERGGADFVVIHTTGDTNGGESGEV